MWNGVGLLDGRVKLEPSAGDSVYDRDDVVRHGGKGGLFHETAASVSTFFWVKVL